MSGLAVALPANLPADASVAEEPGHVAWPGSIYHEPEWAAAISSSYGLVDRSLTLPGRDGRPARLPLFEVRTLGGERVGVSAPFSNYGGASVPDATTERALLERAATLAREAGWSYLEIKRRGPGDAPHGWLTVGHFVSPVIDLRGLDAAGVWQTRLGVKARNQTRMSERRGLHVERVAGPNTTAFRGIYARAMRELGTPGHGARWFAALEECVGPRLITLVAREGTTPVGAALLLEEPGGGILQYCLAPREHLAACPNHALYWAALRLGVDRGWRYLDLGRSRRDSGTWRFKRQWGAVDVATPYHYHLPPGSRRVDPPDQHPARAGFKPFIAVWRRLPLPLCVRLGPLIRPHITT